MGRSYFRDPWVKAPAITGNRDGLGPLFHMRSCIGCHKRGGRGRINEQKQSESMVRSFALFLRLSLPGTDTVNGVVAEPVYGAQLSTAGIDDGLLNGEAIAEAQLRVTYQTLEGEYSDGTPYQLHQPSYHLDQLTENLALHGSAAS
ncbi:MAG: hypothetical protein HON68_06185 [Gammaproteobacteria bacterium]|jgi:CxxC motif-containing protein (DUF1111 family)|nr:hypothetical protein [Gammaproteobacteria bacterium]MBT3489675.1 hypothetical protein [Gammaproteobacteria bacterium]MBT3719277.1 hypothetical protein [Gammaproteobacteria bacterium]MBT3844671.1 hypothetical protein [Gammaproteobacteria bacterium]MBT3892595.1 hypothetical protein [Gammaproteobacteria bacterium]